MIPTFKPREAERINIGRVRYNRRPSACSWPSRSSHRLKSPHPFNCDLTLVRQRVDSNQRPAEALLPGLRLLRTMSVTHYKRLLMEVDLRKVLLPEPRLPDGYAFAAWHPVLLAAHARVKCESFGGEIDSHVFESLSHLAGCERLMRDIAHHENFVPVATWLIRFEGNEITGPAPCATIQGLRQSQWIGSIQNVGVVPFHRGFGLGRALVIRSLLGYLSRGFRKVRLEVTAANRPAVQLYESLGFRVQRASYRTVESSPTELELA
ncbi:MAG: GNAT family N-acetyltransferase [Planctomycetaceae bacterium]